MTESLRGVIVEGPDCSGKTTLVKKLKVAVAGRGWDVLQMGHKPGDQFRRYMSVYLRANRLLLDRGHFSEVVYGNLSRGGRHFAPWEHAALDDLARREFITVLCTGAPDVLRTRHVTRDWSRLYEAFDATMREHIEDRSLVLAQREFGAVVAPRADVVCEALTDGDLDRAAEAVVYRLRGTTLLDPLEASATPDPAERRGEAAGLDRDPEIAIVAGTASPRTTSFATQLAHALGGWRFAASHADASPATFTHLMRDFLSASRLVIEDRHLSALFSGGRFDRVPASAASHGRTDVGEDGLSPFEIECLCGFVRARGLVVVVETPVERAAGGDLLRRWDIPHAFVRLDDRSRPGDGADVEQAIAAVLGQIRGVTPAGA